ncbi:MAG: hypothetical protein ACP5NK_02200 [Thermoplasmata archaeon]
MKSPTNLISNKSVPSIPDLIYIYKSGEPEQCKFQSNGWTHYFNSIVCNPNILADYGQEEHIGVKSCHELSEDEITGNYDFHERSPGTMPFLRVGAEMKTIVPTVHVDYLDHGERILGLYLMELDSGILRIPVHSERVHEFIREKRELELRCYGPLKAGQIIEYSKSINFGRCAPASLTRHSSFTIMGSVSGDSVSDAIEVSGRKVRVHFHEFKFESFHFTEKVCYSILPGTGEHKAVLNYLGRSIPEY